MTLKEVCSVLRISRPTAYRWLHSGRLKGKRAGRAWLFARGDIEACVREAHAAYQTNPTTFTCGDLFSGAGGLSVGFEQVGFHTVFFNDIDEDCARTFAHNFPNAKGFVSPIEQLTAGDVLRGTNLESTELDVLIGGPPCQGFSINAPVRSEKDERNNLFLHYVRLVLEGIRPKFAVLENVPGLVSMARGKYLAAVCQAFERAGYRPVYRILNACHYGVPQERWRLIIVANRVGCDFQFPQPFCFSGARPNFTGGRELTYAFAVQKKGGTGQHFWLRKPISVAEAISDLPPIPSGGGHDEQRYLDGPRSDYQRLLRRHSDVLWNHHCANMARVNLERFEHVKPGGSWRDIPKELLPDGMKKARRSDHTRRYGRLDPDGLSFTIMTKCDPHWGTVVHYKQNRIISVREAARFQSFPDTFRFLGSKPSQYRQVGNAVAPMLAEALARQIGHALSAQALRPFLENPPKPVQHIISGR